MERSLVPVAVIVSGVALAGCGSGAKMTAHYTTTPPTTISGVGVSTDGPPPKPNTPTACVSRWNGAANMSERAAAKQKAPKADTAWIGKAGRSGYFADDAGRCLIYLLTPPKSAVVFVETAPGRFAFSADAMGHIGPNADLASSGRLQLH